MDQVGQNSQPLRSTLELTPILVPYILGFFMYMGIFSAFPIYLQIKQGLTDVEVVDLWAIISGIALLIGALTRIPAGLLSDKIGRIPAMILSYLTYVSSLLIILFISNNIAYIIAVGMVRFGTNIVAMTGRATVSTSSRDLGLKNGLLFSISGLGSFLGPTILGYILDFYSPDVIILFSLGVVLVDFIVFILVTLAVNRWLENNDEISDLDYSPTKNVQKLNPGKVLRIPGVLRLQFFFLMAGIVYGFILSIYSIYGYNILFLSPGVIGLVTGIGSLTQTITAPIVGRLYLYVKDEFMRLTMWLIFVMGSICAIVSPFSKWAFFASFFLLNIGFSGLFTMEITFMRRLVEGSEFSFTFGLASSLVILATSFTGFISPTLYNIIPEANFYVSFLIALLTFIIVLIITPKDLKKRKLLDTTIYS